MRFFDKETVFEPGPLFMPNKNYCYNSKWRHANNPSLAPNDPDLLRKSILGLFGQSGRTCEKKFGADDEQLLRPVFFMFSWARNKYFFFENIVASALKSCIE